MATYTYDLATGVGQVRLKIGDQPTELGKAQFSDEELFYLLAHTVPENSVPLASIAALETLIRKYSTKPKLALGDYQEDYSAVIRHLEMSLANLRTEIGDELDDPAVDVGLGYRYYNHWWGR